jgi:hypothetical protein
VGADPYVDREGRLGNVTYLVFTGVVLVLLVGAPLIIVTAAGKDVSEALWGVSFLIYLKGSRQPRWQPGRVQTARIGCAGNAALESAHGPDHLAL